MIFDHPHFYFDEILFSPRIFDAGPGETVPPGFNTVRIPLDGCMRSHIDWRAAINDAQVYRDQGYKLLWDLDLGLFSRLSLPFSDETQFQALAISVDYFLNDLWPKFVKETLALNLYRGSADFSQGFFWSSEHQEAFEEWLQGRKESTALRKRFCRDVCVQYLEFLAGGFPATLAPMLMLDANSLSCPAEAATLLSREKLSRFYTAVRGGLLPVRELAWEGNSSLGWIGRKIPPNPQEDPLIGVCISSEEISLSIKEVLEKLIGDKTPFRLLSPSYLASEWGGLDTIIVTEPFSIEVQRQLQGFKAAGGKVIYKKSIEEGPQAIPKSF